MNRLFGVTVLLSGAGLIAISACGRDSRDPQMQPAAQIAPAHSPKDAVEAIASARCDREQRCNNVGADAEYQNREHCMNVARADAAKTLDDDDCRHGIKPNDLNECLADLRDRACSTIGGAFDSLSSMMSCRAGELCMD
jgi:hypothetical protein